MNEPENAFKLPQDYWFPLIASRIKEHGESVLSAVSHLQRVHQYGNRISNPTSLSQGFYTWRRTKTPRRAAK